MTGPAAPGSGGPGSRAGETQWGLRTPAGHVVWPPGLYKGHAVESPADRAALIEVLRLTADDLDWPREVFLAQYGWARRVVYDDPTGTPMCDPSAVAGEPLPVEPAWSEE